MSAVDVAYTIEGAGPPLYMVHGIGSRRVTWSKLVAELKADFTCVSFNLRGHGDSPVPPVPYSLDELVEDLEALRDRLGHDRIDVVGHSLGGQIGPAYARTHPERVETVTLLSTAAGRTPRTAPRSKGSSQPCGKRVWDQFCKPSSNAGTRMPFIPSVLKPSKQEPSKCLTRPQGFF